MSAEYLQSINSTKKCVSISAEHIFVHINKSVSGSSCLVMPWQATWGAGPVCVGVCSEEGGEKTTWHIP